MRFVCVRPPALVAETRMKSISSFSISLLQSQIALKTSPMADRGRRMLTDQPQRVLILGRGRVFEPVETHGFDRLGERGRLARQEAVVHIVKDVQIGAEPGADLGQIAGHVAHVAARVPGFDLGTDAAEIGYVMLARALLLRHGVARRWHGGDAALHPHSLVTQRDVMRDRVHQVFKVGPGGMGVDHRAVAALAAEQLVERHVRQLALDIPQRHVDGADGGHGDRATPEIGAAVEELPDVFAAAWVHADQVGHDVVAEIGCRQGLSVFERRVAEAVDALVGHDLEGDVVLAGAADEDFGIGDFHASCSRFGVERIAACAASAAGPAVALRPCPGSGDPFRC